MLIRSVWLAVTYDQLNVGALASFEEICRRIAQLVEAYESSVGGKPNFSGVKHMSASSAKVSVVPSELRSFAMRLSKEEVEVENLRIRAAGNRSNGYDEATGTGLGTGKKGKKTNTKSPGQEDGKGTGK